VSIEAEMSDNIIPHPYRDLVGEAQHEHAVVNSPEGQSLLQAMCKAVNAYSEFLERNGLIYEFGLKPEDPDWPRMKAQALVVTVDYGKMNGIEVALKDGALDRVYGDGVNPDPEELGPPDIPHKRRSGD